MIVHNFETTVTVPQHTVVVPKPACSYQNYTTFRRYFQVLSRFCVLELSYSLYFFLCTYIFMWLSAPLLGASGTRGCRRGRSPCPDALLRVVRWGGWMKGWWVYWWTELSDGFPLIFEKIEAVLMCCLPWLFLICDVHCCLFAQYLLCLCSPLLPHLLKFHRKWFWTME